MIVAESFLAEGPKTRRGGVPCEVHLFVTKSELENNTDGAFMTNGGTARVPAETCRRLTCDAALIEVVEDDRGNVLDIGRRTRTVPAAIRRALNLRDQHRCSFPGCTHELFLDAHHIQHWADGGKTSLDNLVVLCRRHHTFVHEHGYTIDFDDSNRPTFVAPNGTPLSRVPTLPTAPSDAIQALAEQHLAAGLELDAVSLMPQHWNGEPIDLDQIIHVLGVKTLGDVPHDDIPPRTEPPVSEVNCCDESWSGLNDPAYDHWAIPWQSED